MTSASGELPEQDNDPLQDQYERASTRGSVTESDEHEKAEDAITTLSINNEVTKDVEACLPERPSGADNGRDLGVLERIPSGPPYSVFTKRQKGYIVFLTAWGGFFSPFSSSIYFPALNTLAQDLKVSNELINLTLTSFMIFQGLAPTIFGDLADMFGRRPVYLLGFTIYTGANIGLALQNNYAALFVLRCLQSTGSSGSVALGNGVVADISTSGERGKYLGYAQFGIMAAPALGPILGGILSQFLGWRAIFWFLAILTGVYLIPFCITFPETGRKVVGNGSITPPIWNISLLNYLTTHQNDQAHSSGRIGSRDDRRAARAELASQRKLRWPNPMKALRIVVEKDVATVLFYNSLLYTALYDVTSTLPSIFAEIYGFNDLQIGTFVSLSFLKFILKKPRALVKMIARLFIYYIVKSSSLFVPSNPPWEF